MAVVEDGKEEVMMVRRERGQGMGRVSDGDNGRGMKGRENECQEGEWRRAMVKVYVVVIIEEEKNGENNG